MGNENKTDDHKEEQLRKLVECLGAVCEKENPEGEEEDHTTDQSLLNLFYQTYSENQHIETEEFRSQLEPLDDCLVELTNSVERSKATEVENLVAEFCTAYEKHAFIEGMKAGAKMLLELVG